MHKNQEQLKQLVRMLVRESLEEQFLQKAMATLRTPVGSLFAGQKLMNTREFFNSLRQTKLNTFGVSNAFDKLVSLLKQFRIDTTRLESSVAAGFASELEHVISQLKEQLPLAARTPQLWAPVTRIPGMVKPLIDQGGWYRLAGQLARLPQTLVTPRIAKFISTLRDENFQAPTLTATIEGWQDILEQAESEEHARGRDAASQRAAEETKKHAFRVGDLVDSKEAATNEYERSGKITKIDVSDDHHVMVRWPNGWEEKWSRYDLVQARPRSVYEQA